MDFLALIIDLVFVALVVINILEGRRKGFVRIVLSFAAMLLTWYAAGELSQPVAEWANEAFVRGWLSGSIERAVADGIANGSDALIASIPDYIANAAEIAGISIQNLASQLGDTVDPALASEQIYEAIENPLIIPVIRIVSFFILYAVMNWIFAIVIRFISRVFKLPILKSFNRLLGSAVGALKGIIVIAVISIVLGLVAMVTPETEFAQALDQSVIHQTLSDAVHVIFGS